MNARPLLVPLLLAIGCASPPERPPVSQRTPEGVVFGPDPQSVQAVAREAERLSARVRGVVGVDRPDAWELWLLDGREAWVPSSAAGHLAERTVRLGPFRSTRTYLLLHGEQARSTPYVVAHEVAHWFTRHWDLPYILVEGVAQWISDEVTDDSDDLFAADRETVRRLLRDRHPLVADLKPLNITREQFESTTLSEVRLLYAYGSLVAESLGLDGLRQLDGASLDEVRSAVDAALANALRQAPHR